MRRVVALFLLLSLPLAAIAKKPHLSPVAETPPQLAEADQYSAEMRRGADSGTPRALYALHAAVLPGTAEAMARQFLGEQAAVLHLRDAALDDLSYVWSRAGKSGVNVHFEQNIDGVPVYDSRMVVHINPQNFVTMVSSGYRAGASLASAQPLISAAQARGTVIARVQAQPPFRFDETLLTAYQAQEGTRLAWRVRLSPAEPIGSWEGLVDATSGELFVIWDRSDYAHATGSAFDPDPLSSSHTDYGAPMSDNGDADSPALAAQTFVEDLGDIELDNGEYFLKNQWAEVTDHETPNDGFFSQSSPNFLFTRENNGFEASNTFFQIQKSMQYVNQTLGLNIRPIQYSGGVQFDPQGLDGADNSHYDPSTGQLAYGEGCVDDDEDADVIWHELGHGLHDWVTHGALSNQIDGLSEGFGDYWAASYSRSLNQWKPGEPQYQWVYSWDGQNECWAGRTTDYALPWPVGLGEIHTSGQIWSTCLMKIYDQIGRQKIDTATLEGLAMTIAVSTQNDAANAVYQAAQDMGYAAADLTSMHDSFAGCGYIMGNFPGPILISPPAGDGAPSASGKADAAKFGGALPLSLLVMLLGLGALRPSIRRMRTSVRPG